jgi:beta-N-acetylhexosaminidase
MPEDPDVCIRAVLAAVKSGRITRARIDASAAKVLAAKQRVGLFRQRYVNLDHISDDLEEQKLDMLAQNVADESFTLVKDEKHLFPMPSGEGSCLVVMSEGEFSARGQVLVQALHAAHVSPQIYVTHASMPDTLLTSFAANTARCKQVYVAAFITVGANRGNVSLQGGLNGFLKTITSGTSPVALISFGSPYLLRDFPNVSSYAATFSVTSTSEIAVARALLGSIPLTGKLPVSIPPVAKIGDGLFVPAQARPASNGSE